MISIFICYCYALGMTLGKGGVATVVAARYVHTLTLVTAYH